MAEHRRPEHQCRRVKPGTQNQEHQFRNGKNSKHKTWSGKTRNTESGMPIYGTVLLDEIVKHGTSNLENIRGYKVQNSAEIRCCGFLVFNVDVMVFHSWYLYVVVFQSWNLSVVAFSPLRK